MSTRKFFIVLLTAAPTLLNAAFGQDSLKQTTFSINIGLNKVANKDEFQSPYTYKGANLFINAAYKRITKSRHQIIDLSYSVGSVESVVSPEADNKMILLDYDYLFDLSTKTAPGKVSPSLGFGLHTMLSSTNYLPGIEAPKSYSTGSAWLTLSGDVLYRLNRRSYLELQFGLGAIGVAYRPDFEINGKTLMKITTIGESYLFSTRLTYNYRIASKLYLTAVYSYCYFTFDRPQPITILQNGLLAGLRRTF
jgi:hypothetical protein